MINRYINRIDYYAQNEKQKRGNKILKQGHKHRNVKEERSMEKYWYTKN